MRACRRFRFSRDDASTVPTGRVGFLCLTNPAINRWAIVKCPYGTDVCGRTYSDISGDIRPGNARGHPKYRCGIFGSRLQRSHARGPVCPSSLLLLRIDPFSEGTSPYPWYPSPVVSELRRCYRPAPPIQGGLLAVPRAGTYNT